MGFHRMYVEVVSVGSSQGLLEHHFRFPYLTEPGVRHGLSKRSFPGTDRHRSQLGCNDPRVSIMYGYDQITVVSDAPQNSGVSAHAQTVDTRPFFGACVRG